MTDRTDNKDKHLLTLTSMLGNVITLVGPLYLVKQRKWLGHRDAHTHVILVSYHQNDRDLKDVGDVHVLSNSCVSAWIRSFYINIVLDGSVMLARVTHRDILELKNGTK